MLSLREKLLPPDSNSDTSLDSVALDTTYHDDDRDTLLEVAQPQLLARAQALLHALCRARATTRRVVLFLLCLPFIFFSITPISAPHHDTSRSVFPIPTIAAPFMPCGEHCLLDLNAKRDNGFVEPEWKQDRFWDLQANSSSLVTSEATCLSFENRYSRYTTPDTLTAVQIPPTLGISTALLYRVRKEVLQSPMQEDNLRIIRALIVELQQGSGIDVYLMVHTDWDEGKKAMWRRTVPKELRDRIVAFDELSAMEGYPLGTFESIVHDNTQLSIDFFFNLPVASQYSYVWWLEGDVRNTGSWQSFFNHLNASIPHNVPEPYPWELRRSSAEAVSGHGGDSTSPEATTAIWERRKTDEPWQPDLIITSLEHSKPEDVLKWDDRAPGCLKFMDKQDLAKSFVHLTGVSRRFHSLAKQYFNAGNSCYCEIFLLSLAKRHHVPMFVLRSPSWRNPYISEDRSTFHSIMPDAADLYHRDWKQKTRSDGQPICRPGPALLHKVQWVESSGGRESLTPNS